jgi:TRAP-type C4-dicarboxylate transport system substrate-binding protein
MSDFKFDQRAIDKLAKEAVKNEAKRLQKMMDDLLRRYQGRPVSEVKSALAREWKKDGGKVTDPELTEWATEISEGRRITVKS